MGEKKFNKPPTREQFEREMWEITRWIQKVQQEEGDEVIPDGVFAERLKQVSDDLYGTNP